VRDGAGDGELLGERDVLVDPTEANSKTEAACCRPGPTAVSHA
jgi:hypothetical protein